MAVIKFSQNGLSISGGGNPHPVENKRGNVTGWSRQAARNNTRFLQSIIPDDLSGDGWALTLTLREIPESYDDWRRVTIALFDVMRKQPGFLRCHWLMELQRRGAPHLHMAVYFDPTGTRTC